MPRKRFGVGDLVTHEDAGEEFFVIEKWFEPVDPKVEPLYQCSFTRRYNFGWHGYTEGALTKAENVPETKRPDAIKRAAMVLYRLLEAAQEGGMRHRRAEQLHEEFCDH